MPVDWGEGLEGGGEACHQLLQPDVLHPDDLLQDLDGDGRMLFQQFLQGFEGQGEEGGLLQGDGGNREGPDALVDGGIAQERAAGDLRQDDEAAEFGLLLDLQGAGDDDGERPTHRVPLAEQGFAGRAAVEGEEGLQDRQFFFGEKVEEAVFLAEGGDCLGGFRHRVFWLGLKIFI